MNIILMKFLKIFFFHQTALHIAIKSKNIEIIKILLSDKRIDINKPMI